jgi:hypothetical protein
VRQSWPVLSLKFTTACFLGLFLLFFHVDLMFWHCVLLDEAMASCALFFFFLPSLPYESLDYIEISGCVFVLK